MVAQLAAGKALPKPVLAQILEKTDGVPLFVEELTKTLLASDLLRDVGERYVLTGPLPPVDKSGEHLYEAELYRLRGELLLARSQEHQVEAEACFRRSLAIARRQQAKSLELRAAMSLIRLWQRSGQRVEAHALLAPVYGWFTEGFDTADLQEAKALLTEVAR